MMAPMTMRVTKVAPGSVGTIETKFIDLRQPLELDCGRALHPIRVAYETYGTLSPSHDNVILVCHALSGDAHAAGYAKTPPAAKQETAAADFIWPARGKVIAGFAEPRRKGIDIDAKLGDPVLAAAAGRVTYTGTGIPGLGKLVVIKHDNGFITVYAHNRDVLVQEQQAVRRGQKIAEVGSTDADRPKLHFQIRKGSAAVDPLRYLPAL